MIDNYPAHPALEKKNCFSSTQPRNQSIIACPKRQYRKMVVGGLNFYLDGVKDFYFTSLDGILSVNTVSNRVSEKTIVNCYEHAEFNPYFEYVISIWRSGFGSTQTKELQKMILSVYVIGLSNEISL